MKLLLVSLPALVVAAVSRVTELLIARVVQGMSTGAAVGAIGAGLLDIDRVRGTLANGVGPLTGTGSGALVSSLLVEYLPYPERLVYLVLLGILALQAVGVFLMPELATPKPGAMRSLRPAVGVPAQARSALLVAAPALVAVWSLAGFYGSVAPPLTELVARAHTAVLGGLGLFTLAGTAGITVLLTRNALPRMVMFLGGTALVAGVGVTLIGVSTLSATAFFVGTGIAGVGFGAGFQGSLRTVLPLAEAHERAGMLSTVYVICYLAMGLPAVGAGFLVQHVGLVAAARDYGLVVLPLAGLALLGLWVRREPASPVVATEEVSTRELARAA